jgi:hypothetical protein
MTAAGRRDARRPTDDGQPPGVKGAGQAGCIAAPPTIIKAILDALASLDIDHIDMPATPERVPRPCGARLDHGKAAGSGAARPSVSPFWLSAGRLRSNFVAAGLAETEHRDQSIGNPGNVV